MKNTLFIAAAVFVGFGVGFGIGQKTRSAAESNVKAGYDGGKLIVVADIGQAVKTGIGDYLSGLAG